MSTNRRHWIKTASLSLAAMSLAPSLARAAEPKEKKKLSIMRRIVYIHEFELKPEVAEAEFEQALRRYCAYPLPGQHASVLKTLRKTRQGRYGLLDEYESLEAHDRFFSYDGFTDEFKFTDEFLQFTANHPEHRSAWDHVMSLVVQPWTWINYMEVL